MSLGFGLYDAVRLWLPSCGRLLGKRLRSTRYFSTNLKAKQLTNPKNTPSTSDLHTRLSSIEQSLSRRMEKAGFQRSKKFYGSILVSSVIACAGGYLYLFPHKLRQQVVEEVSTVASQSLEDQKIVTKAGQLSKDVLTDILNDENTKDISSDFIKGIIVSDPIREAAIATILNLLNDPRVLELLRIRLSTIIIGILQDDSTRQIVMSQVNAIIQHESVRSSLKTLLKDLTETPEVQQLMAEFFRDVLSSDTVKNEGILLGQQVTSDVISDKDIQEQAGKAIWSAVKYSFTPSMFQGKSNTVQSTNSDKSNLDVVDSADTAIFHETETENDFANNNSSM